MPLTNPTSILYYIEPEGMLMAKSRKIWHIYAPGKPKKPINATLIRRLWGPRKGKQWLFRILANPGPK